MENYEHFCESHAKFEDAIKNISIKLPSLQIIESNAQKLCTNIETSWSLAENVTVKIRKLDNIRNKVQGCLRKVEDLLDLKMCTIGVNMAMKDADYEKAACHIKRFLDLDKNSILISNPSDSKAENQLKNSFETLSKAKDDLLFFINNKFDEAIQKNDRAEIERLFKLFPMLHAEKDGLRKFVQYISSELAKLCQPIFKAIVDDQNKTDGCTVYYAEILTSIFDIYIDILQTNQPMIEASYNKGNMGCIIKSLQNVCDEISHKVFIIMEDDFSIKSKVQTITLNPSAILMIDSTVTSKRLDFILSEISSCIAHVQYFLQYLESTIMADGSEVEAESLHQKASNLIYNSKLCHDVQQMTAQYIILEEYFMRRNYLKAKELDRPLGEGHVTSSIVDDAFFIIKKCVQRAISTSHTDAACAMINHAVTLLENDYFAQTLERALKDGFPPSLSTNSTSTGSATNTMVGSITGAGAGAPSYYYSAIVGGVLGDLSHAAYNSLMSPTEGSAAPPSLINGPAPSQERDGRGKDLAGTGGQKYSSSERELSSQEAFTVTLNNIELSQRYVKKLVQDLEQDSLAAISHHENYEQSKEKIMHCLTNLTLSEKMIQNMLQRGLRSINDNLLRFKTKQFIENLGSVKHNLTEEDLALYQVHDPWVEPLLGEINTLTSTVKKHLSSSLFEKLMGIYVSDIPIYVENITGKSKFNRLGALFFDKELRRLINYVTSLTSSWTTRDKFSRLLQISMVLNADKVEDVIEFCTTGGSIVWKLTPADMKQVLTLREDFSKEDIQKLKI